MTNQPRLRALTERLSGSYYIGSPTVYCDPSKLRHPGIRFTFLQGQRPVLTYVRDPDTESIETVSVHSFEGQEAKQPRPLDYRIPGITWFTSNFVNTCNMDSFLSAWVRKARQTHGKYLKHVQLYDRVGTALFDIADHALCAKENIDANYVKGLWLEAILENSNETHRLFNLPIDCAGNNTYSVFQHLEHHSTFAIISRCQCGTFYHTDYCFEVFDLNQVAILGTPRNIRAAKMPLCLTCNQSRVLIELSPYPTNWHVTFNYNSDKASRDIQTPFLANIPPIIQMKNILFKLEYVTYGQDSDHPTIGHEVSLHFIRHKWYVYDGGQTPNFRRWSGLKYDHQNSQLQTLVYFKI